MESSATLPALIRRLIWTSTPVMTCSHSGVSRKRTGMMQSTVRWPFRHMIAMWRIKAAHAAAELMPVSSAIFPKCVKQTRASLNSSLNEIPCTLSGELSRTRSAYSSMNNALIKVINTDQPVEPEQLGLIFGEICPASMGNDQLGVSYMTTNLTRACTYDSMNIYISIYIVYYILYLHRTSFSTHLLTKIL